MAEFDAHASIEDALEEAAKGLVKKSSDEAQSVEYYSLEELMSADRYQKAQTAAGKAHFGLRMTRLVPPGTG